MMNKLNEEQTQKGINYHMLLQRIIPVPDVICGTGYIKIVAVNSDGPHTQNGMKWDIKARCHDPMYPQNLNPEFDVTQAEVDTWLGAIT